MQGVVEVVLQRRAARLNLKVVRLRTCETSCMCLMHANFVAVQAFKPQHRPDTLQHGKWPQQIRTAKTYCKNILHIQALSRYQHEHLTLSSWFFHCNEPGSQNMLMHQTTVTLHLHHPPFIHLMCTNKKLSPNDSHVTLPTCQVSAGLRLMKQPGAPKVPLGTNTTASKPQHPPFLSP